ncbi:MAG: DUF3291 domain-containing protein, partial [Actinomycetota bacterium]
ISLEVCMLYNPDDAAADLGPGPRYLLGDTSADLGPDLRPDVDTAEDPAVPVPPVASGERAAEDPAVPAPPVAPGERAAASARSSAGGRKPSAASEPSEPSDESPIPELTVSDHVSRSAGPDSRTAGDPTADPTAHSAALSAGEVHPGWHLAQCNIGRLHHPVDDPRVAEFMDNLDPINALADRSPGFVWRLQDEQGNATSIRAFDDETILPNLSVWTSLEALKDYVFRSDHARFLRRRREWFAPMDDLPVLTMWWVPAGHLPTMEEAKERIDHLAEHGPTAYAFTFHPRFDPPSAEGATTIEVEAVESGAAGG